MKKVIIFLLMIQFSAYAYALPGYCLSTCGSNTASQNFCNTTYSWCQSDSYDLIYSITGKDPGDFNYTYCTPLWGPFTTPTTTTYIVCYKTMDECKYNNWITSGTYKEYLTGHWCAAINQETRTQGNANRWRCAKNYYATNTTTGYATGSSDSVITCSACPDGGLTDEPAQASIKSCYKPSGQYNTASGTFNATSKCSYNK